MKPTISSNRPKPKLSFYRRWRNRLIKLTLLGIALVALFATSVFVLGRVPVNRDFHHAQSDYVEIQLMNNGVHVDLVLPMDEPVFPLRKYFRAGAFVVPYDDFSHALIGWGNRKFYLETQTWDDVKLSNVLHAFSGLGDTALHVTLVKHGAEGTAEARRLHLDSQQFSRLCSHIVSSLEVDESGMAIPIPRARYGMNDAFFEAVGHYHLFRTCNVWVGEGLKKAGVKVGVWTVTPDALFSCLPENPR